MLLFKGLIMDGCVLLTSTPECVVSPHRAIMMITWCRPFPFVQTNIPLIKSTLKLESRAIAVGVAMSPRNLGGKYHCRPHPRPRTCTRQFLSETERINRTAPEWRHRLTTATTSSIMWCVYQLNFCGTLSFRTKMASSTHMVCIPTWIGRYVF